MTYHAGRTPFWQSFLTLTLPAHCLVCRDAISQGKACYYCIPKTIADLLERCPVCFSELHIFDKPRSICQLCQIYPLEFQRLRFIWNYSAASRDYIRTMKYRPAPGLLDTAAEKLKCIWPKLFQDSNWDFIIPIPSNNQRQQERGFNQAALLCKLIIESGCAGSQLKLHSKTLKAARSQRKAQADLTTAARLRNMTSGFILDNKFNVEGKSILLVDDVVTTGSTITAASLAFLEHGASSVDVLALAVSPRFFETRYQLWSAFRT